MVPTAYLERERPGIIYAVKKKATNCDTFQRKKWSNIKYGELISKEAEQKPRNNICVDLIGPYGIFRKRKKENLHIKAVIMIDPVTGCFELIKYNNKRVISITNLVGTTWLSKYPILI